VDGFRFDILALTYRDLLAGAWISLKITGISFVVALLAGGAVGAARSRSAFWRKALGPYVEFMRGTPLLSQLFFLDYGLPTVGLNMGSLTAAYLGLGLNGGAYIAEIVRGALSGVHKGQEEAALSLGLTELQTLAFVLLPQAMRTAMPPLVNSFSAMLKDSSLVSVLAITELTRIGQLVYTRTFRAFEIYLAVAVMYFALTYCFTLLSRRLEYAFGTRS
jgi:polar amino acid transport system permease protein